MAIDTPIPLASVAQFSEGAFGDLGSSYSTSALANIMLAATRMCESACDRRLAPFAIVGETQRADGLDVEDALDAYVPLDVTSQLGFSRAQSLGSTLLCRHYWLREHPPRYNELWAGALTSVSLVRSFSGTQSVNVSQMQFEADTGHVRFPLGTFVPPGTTIVTAYSGGYATTPGDLVTANCFMAASIVLKQLDPAQSHHGHDPDALRLDALELLAPYTRK